MAMRSSAADMLDRMALGQPSRSRPGPGGYVSSDQDKRGRPSSPISAYGGYISSGFGHRSPLGIGSTNHKGYDLSVGPGVQGYPAEAVMGGVVTKAGKTGAYGNLVEIEHQNGYKSRYGHLGKIGVKKGDYIARGTPVGLVGNTGRSSGPHLHFEVRDPKGNAVNPSSLVDFSARPTPTPSARPMSPAESRNIASAYGDLARSMPPGMSNLAGRMAPGHSLAGLSPSIDPSRFAGMPDPARFGAFAYSGPSAPMSPAGGYGTAEAAARSQAVNDWSDIPEPSRERFGYTPPTPERFGSFPSIPSSVGPFSPSGPYARAEAPPTGPAMSMSAPSVERFGSLPAPDPSRFGPAPSMASAPIGGIYSPAGAYASVTGMDPAATASVSQGLAGNLMGVPAASVSPVSVSPASVPSNMLAPSFAPPALDMTAVNAFAPQTAPLMPSLPAPNMPVAMPQQPLPAPPLAPPRVVKELPVAAMGEFPSMPAAPRSYTPADIYGGQIGSAVATDGNTVGRDAFGNTTVTNRYGVTTAMTPNGKQSAYGGPPGVGGPSSLFGGMSAPFSGIGKPGVAPGYRGVGTVGGALVGAILGGLPGALAGGMLGRSIGGFADRNTFPSAPSVSMADFRASQRVNFDGFGSGRSASEAEASRGGRGVTAGGVGLW